MRTATRLIFALLISAITVLASAQPDALDPTFNPTDIGLNGGGNHDIQIVALQPDGRILIGGVFTAYDGTPRNGIARLNADGTLDTTFNPGTGANDRINTIVLQPDGRILIGGIFTAFNGVVRLNPDGSLDKTFNPGTGANYNWVDAIALQPDGRILIAGRYTAYNSLVSNRIARLNADGTLDATFNSGTWVNGWIDTIALQPDGRILIGGWFTAYNSVARNRIARLNPDGTLDTTFNPGTGANDLIGPIILQPDGRILINEWFIAHNGVASNRITSLNADGTLDTTFNPGTGANNWVNTFAIQPDGHILIGGEFTAYNGVARNHIARLNANGTLDTTFNPGTGANGWIEIIALQPDGRILIGGNFTTYNGIARNRIARLNADGSLDPTWMINPGTGANNSVHTIAIQPDGRILIGGWFTAYNSVARSHIARLNPDGTLDTTFNPGTGANDLIGPITLQPDGRILIGGYFTLLDGTAPKRIARLNADGSMDMTFNPGTGANNWVNAIAQQPDGRILIGGEFTSYNGTARNRIARLNADGTLDSSFDPGTGAVHFVETIALQPDGRILINVKFTAYNSVVFNRITRLNADGTLDATFYPGTGANGWIGSIALQPDGRILIGGDFTAYNGVARNCLARLNANGTLDMTFNPRTGTAFIISAIALQPDGRILINGEFNPYNNVIQNHIARLNANGTLDTSFDPGTGTNDRISTIALQPDGRILIGGYFTAYKGIGRNRITRLQGDGFTSIPRLPLAGISVYPNPVADRLTMESGSGNEVQFTLINAMGHALQRGNFQGSITIPTQHLPAGIYLIHFTCGQATVTKRVVKR